MMPFVMLVAKATGIWFVAGATGYAISLVLHALHLDGSS